MSSYTDIIARLEAAAGPSRELDAMIWCALHPEAKYKSHFAIYGERGGYDGESRRTRIEYTLPPKRTSMVTSPSNEPRCDTEDWSASLDAAILLVERMLPGWCNSSINTSDGEFAAYVWKREDAAAAQDFGVEECRSSRSIALLLAMFRALEAKEDAA